MDNGLRAQPDVCTGCQKWGGGGCTITDWKDVPADRGNRCSARQEFEKFLSMLNSEAATDAWVEEQARKAGMA